MASITIGRTLSSGQDSVTAVQGSPPWTTKELTGLVPAQFDHIQLAYDGSNRISTATYKTGGPSGTTVATISLTYVGASSRIATVSRT